MIASFSNLKYLGLFWKRGARIESILRHSVSLNYEVLYYIPPHEHNLYKEILYIGRNKKILFINKNYFLLRRKYSK